MSEIINGKVIARKIREELKETIKNEAMSPGLAVILVGEDPASHTYVNLKEKTAAAIGIRFEKIQLPASSTEEQVIDAVQDLNGRTDIHGIIVQLPLPSQIDASNVIRVIRPKKDADGFLEESPVEPVMVQVVEILLNSTGADFDGRIGVVVANNLDIFARPIVDKLNAMGMQAHAIKPEVANLTETLQGADVVVTAIGKAGAITKEMIRQGAIIVDIGITKTPEGIKGDVSPEAQIETAHFTPVPGGVGPVTVATLLKNVVELERIQKK